MTLALVLWDFGGTLVDERWMVQPPPAFADDKNELCRIALERLGFTGPRSEALLIDNRCDLTEAWAREGGAGYDFRGDDQFDIDWPGMLG